MFRSSHLCRYSYIVCLLMFACFPISSTGITAASGFLSLFDVFLRSFNSISSVCICAFPSFFRGISPNLASSVFASSSVVAFSIVSLCSSWIFMLSFMFCLFLCFSIV